VRRVDSDRIGAMLGLAVLGAFAAGLAVVATMFPNPADGPAPPGTRVAYDVVLAACVVALAAVPLVMWRIDRGAGRRPGLAWRIAAVAGAALAMLAVGWGVLAWAHPPHDLRQCFIDHRGGGVRGRICESGLLNRPLGLRRLDEGLAAAFVILVATALLAARLGLPPAPPRALRRSRP